jgi:hypothetical protein
MNNIVNSPPANAAQFWAAFLFADLISVLVTIVN